LLYNKKILALVPARGGSKGIKNKNLKKIKNKSLIELTSIFIDKCEFIDEKVLSSDSHKILKIGKKLKFTNVKRPDRLSGDNINDFKVINHTIKSKNFNHYDYLIYLQPSSPIRKYWHLKSAIKNVIKKKLNGSWSVSKINKKNHPCKILINKNGFLKLYDKSGKNFVSRQKLEDIYIRNGIFYIFSINSIKKFKSIYLPKMELSLTHYKYANIDNLSDLKIAKKLYK
jgi:CMP-N,N'-diacetyllegionaminic acid synthase